MVVKVEVESVPYPGDMMDTSCDESAMDLSESGKKQLDGIIKGPWTREEDNIVVEMVQKLGAKRWSLIASHIPVRAVRRERSGSK